MSAPSHVSKVAPLDHLEPMERTVLMVKLETPVHQETEESLEKMEVQEFKV